MFWREIINISLPLQHKHWKGEKDGERSRKRSRFKTLTYNKMLTNTLQHAEMIKDQMKNFINWFASIVAL